MDDTKTYLTELLAWLSRRKDDLAGEGASGAQKRSTSLIEAWIVKRTEVC